MEFTRPCVVKTMGGQPAALVLKTLGE